MDNLQQDFFQEIKQNMPAHLSMVDEVANLLNISTDSAYRRIRNEKTLSLEETKILAGHFKISLDYLFNLQTGTGSFAVPMSLPKISILRATSKKATRYWIVFIPAGKRS